MTSRFKGAIFDMDGTLLDSMPTWRYQNVEFLKDMHLPMPKEMEGKVLYTPTWQAARIFLSLYDIGMTEEEITRDYEARMDRCYQSFIQPKPFAREFLQGLQSRGVALCVATLTPADIATNALAKQDFLRYFRFVTQTEIEGVHKSSGEYFKAVAKRLGCEPEECLVFEDALYAMKGAKEAGCTVVAIEDVTALPHRQEIKKTCDLYAESYEDLLEKLPL